MTSERQSATIRLALSHLIPVAERFVYDMKEMTDTELPMTSERANALLRSNRFFSESMDISNIGFIYETKAQPGIAMNLYRETIKHYSGR